MLVQRQINLLALSRLEVFDLRKARSRIDGCVTSDVVGELYDFRVGAFMIEVLVTLLNDSNRSQIS